MHFEIRFKQHNGGIFTKAGLITVELRNNPIPEKILSKFEFDNCITNDDRLVFYINAEESNINESGLWAIGMDSPVHRLQPVQVVGQFHPVHHHLSR